MHLVRWICTLSLLAAPVAAQQTDPLSAIDWLSNSVVVPQDAVRPEPPRASSAAVANVTVQPLDAPSPDGMGLLTSNVTGLPADLWGRSDPDELVRLIAEFPEAPLPAVQEQFRTLMLASLNPPQGAGPEGRLFQARLDALLARGALEEAADLIDHVGIEQPELFRRAFDVALLTGREDAACGVLRSSPGILASFPSRIFCLARGGDWPAAALTLETAEALGQITPEEDVLLARFLDPELAEGQPALPPPRRPNPLNFRILEAIGEGLPTENLPLAFAHADLRSITGWKPRINAAERLARAGALRPKVLLGIYSERRPAASGGVWDRVDAVQKFEAAVTAVDLEAVAATLEPAWREMSAAGLEIPFAQAYGAVLPRLPLTGDAARLALRVGLLSPDYERLALNAREGRHPFAVSLAKGLPDPTLASTPHAQAIAEAFAEGAEIPPALSARADGDRLGEAVLLALGSLALGREADLSDIAGALAFLRSVGLEDTARRAALQMYLLGPGA